MQKESAMDNNNHAGLPPTEHGGPGMNVQTTSLEDERRSQQSMAAETNRQEISTSQAKHTQNSQTKLLSESRRVQENQESSSSSTSLRSPSIRQSSSNEDWSELSDSFQHNIAEPGRKALHNFFYVKSPPPKRSDSSLPSQPRSGGPVEHGPAGEDGALQSTSSGDEEPPGRLVPSSATPHRIIDQDPDVVAQEREDREYVEKFWTVYDDIIILSLFTQIGILCRLGMANWFKIFDGVFHSESALFTNLPLNCCSCFLMGILCSGESLMEIIGTRFTPPRLQQDLHRDQAAGHELLSPLSGHSGDSGFSDDDNDSYLEEGEMTISTSAEQEGHDKKQGRRRWRLRARRRGQRQREQPGRWHKAATRTTTWQPKNQDLQKELREVQLLALERRIRMSPCLVLFPIKKEDVDVVENYFNEGYQKRHNDANGGLSSMERGADFQGESFTDGMLGPKEESAFCLDNHDLALDENSSTSSNQGDGDLVGFGVESLDERSPSEVFQDEIVGRHTTKENAKESSKKRSNIRSNQTVESLPSRGGSLRTRRYGQVNSVDEIDYGTHEQPDLDQIISNVATDVSQKISRIRRVRLVDGWDVGTTPEEKSEDLMLGLRDGLCGALSSFSSWISSMINLVHGGSIRQAFVGVVLGIQLPIFAYRFGQHIAVYIFVWRCRCETKQDNHRGNGIQLNTDDDENDMGNLGSIHSMRSGDSLPPNLRNKSRPITVDEEESETPSVRAIITALFIMGLVAQLTSLNLFYEPEDRLVALSLLFSPLGVLTRWRLSMLNSWRPSFLIGTFACNIGACALPGSLGSLIAGNPGPRERIALQSLIAGFGGTLSSVARFIVEILAGVDPVLFRMDGVYYAVCSVGWGLLVSFLFAASVDWADSVE